MIPRPFDHEIDYTDASAYLQEQPLQGQRFEVCTVRQRDLKDLPLGDLIWLLYAAQARHQGAAVTVTDFYDKPGTPHHSVVALMEIVGLSPGEDVTFRRAEDVPRNDAFWRRFCDYVRTHREESETWETIGTIREGILSLLETEGYDVPTTLDRFLEELSVWVESLDADAIQILNHETETTAWVRRLYASFRKRFLRIALPFENEYRGKYRQVTPGAEPIIHQRRIRDLFDKLTQPPEAFTSDEDPAFYRHLFDQLIQALSRKHTASSDASSPEPDESTIEDDSDPADFYDDSEQLIQADLLALDPKLLAYYLQTHQKSLEAYIEDDRAFHKDWVASVIAMHRAQRRQGPARLMEVFDSLKRLDLRPEIVLVDRDFENFLSSPEIPVEELADLWNSGLEKSYFRSHPRRLGHPAADRVAKELPSETPSWTRLRDCVLEQLKSDLPVQGGLDCPLVNRVLTELAAENPAAIHSIFEAHAAQARTSYLDFHLQSQLDRAYERFRAHVQQLVGISAPQGGNEREWE